MCLAVPAELMNVISVGLRPTGKTSAGGVIKELHLACMPETQIDNCVTVHVGFALSRIDEDETRRVFDYLEEMGELGELYDG